MKNLIKLFSYTLMFAASCFIVISCGDDDVSGCTNVNAENYNPLATTDDGTCVLARTKFLGTYTGAFACPFPLDGFNRDNFTFTISESVDQSDEKGIVIQLDPAVFPLAVAGSVTGNTMTLDQEFPGQMVEVMGSTVTADLAITGSATVSGNSLTGTLTITTVTAAFPTPIVSTCTISGTK